MQLVRESSQLTVPLWTDPRSVRMELICTSWSSVSKNGIDLHELILSLLEWNWSAQADPQSLRMELICTSWSSLNNKQAGGEWFVEPSPITRACKGKAPPPTPPHLTLTPLAAATTEVLPSLAMLLYQISWERKGAGETVPANFAVFLSHHPAVLVHGCRRHRRFRHCHCIHVSASCSKWMLLWNATCLFRGTVCSCVQSRSLQLCSESLSAVAFRVALCSCIQSRSLQLRSVTVCSCVPLWRACCLHWVELHFWVCYFLFGHGSCAWFNSLSACLVTFCLWSLHFVHNLFVLSLSVFSSRIINMNNIW